MACFNTRSRFTVCLFHLILLGSVCILECRGRPRLGRNNEDNKSINDKKNEADDDPKPSFSKDLSHLEQSIKQELIEEQKRGDKITPKHLEEDVVVHNANKPWWKRLGGYLRDNFGDLVKGAIRRAFSDIVIPTLFAKIG